MVSAGGGARVGRALHSRRSAERRGEEDALSATVYADLPYPENRLVALAHSLVVRGVIDESELDARLAAVRARLQS